MASQAGHAFLGAFCAAQEQFPDLARDYARDAPGTKVVLCATEATLEAVYAKALAFKVPVVRIVDTGHVLVPFFDGSAVLTSVGLGPIPRSVARRLVGTLPLVR